jgi:hypothetical protein
VQTQPYSYDRKYLTRYTFVSKGKKKKVIILIMPIIKKHIASKKAKATKTVVVTKTKEPASKSAFAKKLVKINNLLAKSALLNS